MEKGTKGPARSYSKEYKVEAVKLAQQIGGKKAAAELGIPDGVICNKYCSRSDTPQISSNRNEFTSLTL